MRILVVSDEERGEWLAKQLSKRKLDVSKYSDVWRDSGDTHETKRLGVVEAIKKLDAVLLDLTDSSQHPLGALALGIAVTLGKPAVMVADVDANHLGGVRQVLRYSRDDAEAGELFGAAVQESLENPGRVLATTDKPTVFISYCHADVSYLTRLKVHLRPLERGTQIRRWSDTDIRPGTIWKEEIAQALDQASIAILLVSADFLASEFIVSNELPPLLKNARSKGATILPLVLTSCRFSRDPDLSIFQAVNNPSAPLSSLPEPAREKYYDKVAAEVERLLVDSTVSWS